MNHAGAEQIRLLREEAKGLEQIRTDSLGHMVISLSPRELAFLHYKERIQSAGLTVELTPYRCLPHASVYADTKGGGVGFEVKLSRATPIVIPEAGQQYNIALIPLENIHPADSLAADRYDRLIGPVLGGIVLNAHGFLGYKQIASV